MKYLHNPGSKEAQDRGCTCAVIDNHYGKGIDMGNPEPDFWITEDCPIHGNIANALAKNVDDFVNPIKS